MSLRSEIRRLQRTLPAPPPPGLRALFPGLTAAGETDLAAAILAAMTAAREATHDPLAVRVAAGLAARRRAAELIAGWSESP